MKHKITSAWQFSITKISHNAQINSIDCMVLERVQLITHVEFISPHLLFFGDTGWVLPKARQIIPGFESGHSVDQPQRPLSEPFIDRSPMYMPI